MAGKLFQILNNDLQKAVDVDDLGGRSVPVNMNWAEEGFLTKDTGYIPFGSVPNAEAHSHFFYKKKDGSFYFIRALNTKLQKYSYADREWYDIDSSPTFTAGARFGYDVYNNNLYFGNSVESLYKWDGATFTEFVSAPKGNILEVYEDRLFVSGVTAEPLSVYYSNVGNPEVFSVADVVKPLGNDFCTGLVNYYGVMLIFKQKTIWKLSFVYDQTVTLFVPKLELQSGNYGACSRRAYAWVENDIWFFTGTEVRSIGYKDQQIGVLGVNTSVISDHIKVALAALPVANQGNVVCFYNNRRFYLGLGLSSATNDTMYVCHTLYGNSWTKYTGRDKARAGDAVVVDGIIYSSAQSSPYGTIKWTVETADTLTQNAHLTTEN